MQVHLAAAAGDFLLHLATEIIDVVFRGGHRVGGFQVNVSEIVGHGVFLLVCQLRASLAPLPADFNRLTGRRGAR